MSSFALPDPWMPLAEKISQALMTGVPSNFASGSWAVANQASYVPVIFPADVTLYAISTRGISTEGNYDIGFYDPDMNLISSSGSQANVNDLITHLFSQSVEAGVTYWAALSYSATPTFYRSIADDQFQMDILELAQEASAFPLPATMTPVRNTTSQIPLISFGIV
jgi:hypothetical protein